MIKKAYIWVFLFKDMNNDTMGRFLDNVRQCHVYYIYIQYKFYDVILCSIVSYYTLVYYITSYCITLHSIILYYIILTYIVFHYYIQFHLNITYIFIPKIPDEPMPPKQPGNLPLAEAPRSNGLILASKSSTSAIILCCSVTMKTTYS